MTTIRLHDSMTRTKREFIPRDPKNVRMYVCGPTVYDRAHIGNARPVVVFDVLFRLLRHVYGPEHVTYVRNVTDIEDKIIARAAENGEPIEALTARTYDWFQQDMAALGCLPPTHQPRATEHVGGMVAMIERLIARGAAYAAEGHVLFSVRDFPDYGRLSGRSVEDMIAGARVEVAPYKRDPMDFVLWKPSDASQPGWDSPWGRGRPGWHIECSAMARALLGGDFDIHGGGADLMFPHHENEIAQSRCAHPDEGFAGLWMHNGMVRIDGEKMSKSLGNILILDELVSGVSSENRRILLPPMNYMEIRLAILISHYRQPLDLNAQRAADASRALEKWASAVADKPKALEHRVELDDWVLDAICDDLNTSAVFHRLHHLADRAREPGEIGLEATSKLHAAALLIGIDLLEYVPSVRRDIEATLMDAKRIDALLLARAEARKAKDFQRADTIRAALDQAGVVVMDRVGGPSEYSLSRNFDPAKLDGIDA